MHRVASSSSRGLRRIAQSLKLAQHSIKPGCRSYTNFQVSQKCGGFSSQRKFTNDRWTTQWTRYASTSSGRPRTEDPLKATTAPPKTHYEFFPQTLPAGPPPTGPFVIDVRQLRKEFLQLQAVAHPDRHPPEMKLKAEGTSARINEAYKVLQNPLLRAQYLLSLRGVDVAEDETAKVEDPELLMEVLETREEIEDAQHEADLDELRSLNNGRIEASEDVLDEAFKNDDIDLAKAEAVKLRYWINIKESIDAWEPGKPVVLNH